MNKLCALMSIGCWIANPGCAGNGDSDDRATQEITGIAHAGPRADVTPSALTIDGIARPLDLDRTPRFGWHVNLDEQVAYEIRVSTTRAKAEALDGDVWTSGKVVSPQQNGIVYAGPDLAASQRYFWRVRTWGPRSARPCWSDIAWFGTGPGTSWSSSTSIWTAPDGASWTDYALTAHLTVDEVALGIRFRAPDLNNGYMWQFRGGDNRLVAHRLQGGTFTVLQSVSLPAGTLAIGQPVEIRIEAIGSTIRTFIGGTLVHTYEDAMFPRGGVGVRTGNSESGAIADISVIATDGTMLLQTDFPASDRSFSCGAVSDGALHVPRAGHCLTSGMTVDWAFLRKEFTPADKPIAWATVYATGTSTVPAKQYVYKLYLDGNFVGLGPTRPIANETRYDGFDVGPLIERGRPSTLAAIAYTTSGQAFQAELVVAYDDGTRDIIGTDRTWQAFSGAYALPTAGSIGTTFYRAPKENLDARNFPDGFDAPGFDASAWHAATEKGPLGALAAAPMAKVQEQLRSPTAILEVGPGHYVLDFGRTWVGGIRYQVDHGTAGGIVDVRFGEVMAAPTSVRYLLNTGNEYRDLYTLKDGPHVFQTWGMRVFRYVEILGAPEPITSENVAALALVYPFDASAATFHASDANLESVWQLSKNTIEAVAVNFYTDSWTRERSDYEGDAYLQLRSSLYLTDDVALGRYSIDYFASNRTWPTEWPLYVILAIHDTWRQTGETRQLEDAYPGLVAKLPDAWLDSATQLIRKTAGSNGCNSTTDCDLVDWPDSERDGFVFRPYNTVVNALAYRAYQDMAEIATAIARADDAARFAARADALRAALNARLYVAEDGRYDDGMDGGGTLTGHRSQHASAFALAFGVPEATEAPRVAAYVASRGMACSVYCAAFLIDGLYRAGTDGAALALLTSTGTASWMNMIRLGAGATSEAWDPSLKSNLTYSHPWAASPAFLIPSDLFGIQPLDAGYARFRVAPRPGQLDRAAVTVPTVRGKIGAAFDRGPGGSLRLAVWIPGNTRADVSIPVPDGTTTVYVDHIPHAVEPESGYATLHGLRPGCKIVSAEPPAASSGTDDAPRIVDVCRDADESRE
jgi:alpha-L-rhamnosidase